MKTILLIISFVSITISQDLNQILIDALKDHPLLKIAKQRESNLRNEAGFQSSLDDPRLIATYFPNPIMTANGAQDAVLQLSQSFPFFGTLGLKKEMIDYTANSVREERLLLRSRLIFDISSSYYQLAAVQEKFKLIESYKDLMNSFYQSALVKYENALSDQQTILKTQTEIVHLADQLIELKIEKNTLLMKLNQMANTDYQSIVAGFTVSERDTAAVQIENLPQIKSLEQLQLAKQAELDLVQKNALPVFQLGVQYSIINERSGITGNKDAIGIQFGFSLPFFSRKYDEKEAAVLASKMSIDEQLNYQKSLTGLRIAELKTRIGDLQKRLKLYEDNLIVKAELTLQSSLSSYETAALDFIHVLDAERFLLTVKKQAIDLKADLRIAQAELKKEVTVYQSGDKNE